MKPTILHLLTLATAVAPLLAQEPPRPSGPPPGGGERKGESRSNFSSGGGSSGSSRGRSFGSGSGAGSAGGSESRFDGGGMGPGGAMFETGRSRASKPIIASVRPMDAKDRANAEADLAVMARLLEKELERASGNGQPNAMGIALTVFEGRGSTAMLLDGHGAVFTLQTRLPLTAPPARPTEKSKSANAPETPWERTQRELFGPGGGGPRERGPGGWPGMDHPAPPPAYDAGRVESLQKSLLETLKHASHIRALKGEDLVTVVVQGSGSSGFGGGYGSAMGGGLTKFSETRTTISSSVNGEPPKVETRVSRDGGPAGGYVGPAGEYGGPAGESRAATLTLRAKKADCDDFAQGKLTAEQFAKKALVNLH